MSVRACCVFKKYACHLCSVGVRIIRSCVCVFGYHQAQKVEAPPASVGANSSKPRAATMTAAQTQAYNELAYVRNALCWHLYACLSLIEYTTLNKMGTAVGHWAFSPLQLCRFLYALQGWLSPMCHTCFNHQLGRSSCVACV